ncbi:hypothetical protein [Phenylobacterium sp.]|uniref:hypothetical protein n=1 Tax=Phenylobacterium sp. TaxID=1871053 RepID=UPI0012201F72|nr:hypothetical protein [Phenylobacterium sp.]THD53722.1 MAG: hypothetical protein E8A12_18235 [Phenylobacterium sp.]
MRPGAWRSAATLAACALGLGACQSLQPKSAPPHLAVPPLAKAPAPAAPPPQVVTVTAAAKSCVSKALPRAPKYPDTDAALRDAGGAADRYQLMAAGRLLREKRLADLEKVVDGCR